MQGRITAYIVQIDNFRYCDVTVMPHNMDQFIVETLISFTWFDCVCLSLHAETSRPLIQIQDPKMWPWGNFHKEPFELFMTVSIEETS